jgi:MFS family permease
MPRIIAELHGLDRYTWVVTAYVLASMTMIPVVGKLSDQFGRKWFQLGGTTLSMSMVLGAMLAGPIIGAFKRYQLVIVLGALLMAAGSFLLTLMTPTIGLLQAILYMVLAGIGTGSFFALATSGAECRAGQPPGRQHRSNTLPGTTRCNAGHRHRGDRGEQCYFRRPETASAN